MRYLLKFSYDGTAYCGFQTQPGLLSIQECLENALTKINNGKKTTITSTGRTDKAFMRYANMDMLILMLILLNIN